MLSFLSCVPYCVGMTYCRIPKFNLGPEHDTLQEKTRLWSHDFQVLFSASGVCFYDLSILQIGAKKQVVQYIIRYEKRWAVQ